MPELRSVLSASNILDIARTLRESKTEHTFTMSLGSMAGGSVGSPASRTSIRMYFSGDTFAMAALIIGTSKPPDAPPPIEPRFPSFDVEHIFSFLRNPCSQSQHNRLAAACCWPINFRTQFPLQLAVTAKSQITVKSPSARRSQSLMSDGHFSKFTWRSSS